MSIEAMTVVLHHSQAKGTAKLLLLGIANHEGDGGAWPSIATLARYASCTEAQVRRLCRQLEEMRELSVEFNEGGGLGSDPRYRPNRYLVLVRCPTTCDGSTAHHDSDRAPTRPLKDPGRAYRPVQGARTGPSGRAPTRGESLLETSIEPSLKELPLARLAQLILVDNRFDVFWEAYPRKEGKRDARKVFDSLMKTVDAEDIMDGLAVWCGYWTTARTETVYIKTAAPWLRGERWREQPPRVAPRSSVDKFNATTAVLDSGRRMITTTATEEL